METTSAKERLWKSQLEYLNKRPFDKEKEWMEMVTNKTETLDLNMLPLVNKNNLPTKKSVLVLYHFFRNLDSTSSKEINK
jgi:hypothetical protein